MVETILRREHVAERLAIDPRVLVRYEQLGLIRSIEDDGVVGYRPAEIRRIWTILTFQRDLGVNLAGVEVILRLRERMDDLERALARVAHDLRSAVEAGAEDEAEAEEGVDGDA